MSFATSSMDGIKGLVRISVMKPTNLLATLCAGAALTLLAKPLSAQTLTPDNPTAPTVVNSISVGMNGIVGYEFFDVTDVTR